MADIYRGPNPQTIGKTRKYKVKLDKSVALEWDVPGGAEVRILLSSEEHPDLVAMVNEIKQQSQGSDGGAFYLNEFQQVIVPAGRPVRYYLAGCYSTPLRFCWDDDIISGEARGLDGRALDPGAPWTGPLVGIPYVLAAGGQDVYYNTEIEPNVVQKVRLTSVVQDPERVLSMIRSIIGTSGGKFYINEYREMFRPSGGTGPGRYIGRLASELPWFPKP
jgi:hypothetical protein